MTTFTMYAAPNSLVAELRTETATETTIVMREPGSRTAWMIQEWFECSTMAEEESQCTYNARDRAADWALGAWARRALDMIEKADDEGAHIDPSQVTLCRLLQQAYKKGVDVSAHIDALITRAEQEEWSIDAQGVNNALAADLEK